MPLVTRVAPEAVLRQLNEMAKEWIARRKDLTDVLEQSSQDVAVLRARLVNMLFAWHEFLEMAVGVADGCANACGFALTALERELSNTEAKQAFNRGARHFWDGVVTDNRHLKFCMSLAANDWAEVVYSTTKIASECFVDSGAATARQARRLKRAERATDLAIFGAISGLALVTGAWTLLGAKLASRAVSLGIQFQSSWINHRASALAGQKAEIVRSLHEQVALMKAQAWAAQRARVTYREIGGWLQAATWS